MFTATHSMYSAYLRQRERMPATIAAVIRVKTQSGLNLVLPRLVPLTLPTQRDYDHAESGLARPTAWKRKASVAAELRRN